MEKTIGLILVLLFSVLIYEKFPEVDVIFFVYFLFLALGIWILFDESNTEKIAKMFTEKLGVYNSHPGYNHSIKFKGSIEYNEKRFSLETDQLLKTVKIFGYNHNQALVDLSKYVGLKRKTVLFNDYKLPNETWSENYLDHRYNIFFIIEENQARKLLMWDKINKKADYSMINKWVVIKVYTRD